MNVRKTILFLLLLAGFPATACAAEPLACNLGSLGRAERERQHVLSGKLERAAIRREELETGYAIVLDPAKLSISQLAEWVSLEARCCPFLDFGIELSSKDHSLTLRLTGHSREVKSFLEQEVIRPGKP